MIILGREKELSRLLENLKGGCNTLVYGACGSGKSALLSEAASRLADDLPAKPRSMYIKDCSNTRKMLREGLEGLEGTTDGASLKRVHRTTRREGHMRIQDLRDYLIASLSRQKTCLLLDHLPKFHARFRHLLELLEPHCTLACVVTARANEYDLYFWRFDRIELSDLPGESAIPWIEADLALMGYESGLKIKIALEIYRLTEGNPGAVSRTLELIRQQDRRLDDPVRVRRMYVDARANALGILHHSYKY